MPTIYTISHPSEPNVIYIGKTQASLIERLHGHINANNGSKVSGWISRLNKGVAIEPLEVCDSELANKTEMFWIEQFRSWGFTLLNKNGNTVNSRPKHKINPVGRPRGRKGRVRKPKKAINQYDIGGNLIAVHYGARAASIACQVDFSTVWRQLKGKCKTRPYKYIFKYAA
jgi:hypothetical protein